MLLFYCASDDEMKHIRRKGLPADVPLWTALEAAQQHDPERILVVDALAWEEDEPVVSLDPNVEQMSGPPVPPRAIENLDPYRPPVPVTAAGGYVVQPNAAAAEPDLLMIYRRGVWDLPKGKREEGESIEACAQREVREEVGAEQVHLVRPLGATWHGYPMKGRHAVKTTHWFLMTTSADDFMPQRTENIEQVAWIPWLEAKDRTGYATLREHMNRVEPVVLDVVKQQLSR